MACGTHLSDFTPHTALVHCVWVSTCWHLWCATLIVVMCTADVQSVAIMLDVHVCTDIVFDTALFPGLVSVLGRLLR